MVYLHQTDKAVLSALEKMDEMYAKTVHTLDSDGLVWTRFKEKTREQKKPVVVETTGFSSGQNSQ